MNAYISRENVAPSFPEHVDQLVELMTEELESKGFEVEVGNLHRSQEDDIARDAVEAAWENACSRMQSFLINEQGD